MPFPIHLLLSLALAVPTASPVGDVAKESSPPVVIGSPKERAMRTTRSTEGVAPSATPDGRGPSTGAAPAGGRLVGAGRMAVRSGGGGAAPVAAKSGSTVTAPRGGAGSVSTESGTFDLRLGSSAPSVDDVLAGWGSGDSAADANGDGGVDGMDLAYALAGQLAGGGGEPPAEAPLLTPGAGFDGDTPEPAISGSEGEPGYGARAIARWNAVPHRTYSAPFTVGVVAFHAHGIDRVEFSLNGGAWTSVAAPTLNPESQTIEYWVRIDPAQLAAGEAEVRAVVHPSVGSARVLAGAVTGAGLDKGEYSLYFVADPAETLPRTERFVSPTGSDATGDGSVDAPFQSIMKAAKSIAIAQGGKADGGVVNLLPGEHVYGGYTYSLLTSVEQRWLTIRPAPGVAAEAAPIVAVSTNGIRVARVCFDGVAFRPNAASNGIIVSNGIDASLWLRGCRLEGAGKHIPGDWCLGWKRVYATDCTLTGSMNGLGGELVRNLAIDEVGSDAFTGARLCVNSTVRSIHPGDSGFHPDFHQIYVAPGTVAENYILFNSHALEPVYAQGLFAGNNVSIRDIAIVASSVSTLAPGNVMRALQYGGPTHHLLIQGCEVLGPALWRSDMNFIATEIVLRDNVWSGDGPQPSPLAGVLELED